MKLSDPVSVVPLVGPAFQAKLNKLYIYTIEDLLYHIPARLTDFTNVVLINKLEIGQPTTITGEIISIDNVYTKTGKNLQLAKVTDGEGILEVIWMRQPYLVNILKPGNIVSLSGELKFWGKKKAFVFPQYEKLLEIKSELKGKIIPIYPLTEGVSSKKIASRIKHVLENIDLPNDFLNKEDLKALNLMGLAESIYKIHLPESKSDWENAKRRLAFNELLLLQIQNTYKRLEYRKTHSAHTLEIKNNYIDEFISNLPFKLTASQTKSLGEILSSFNKEYPMNRLLQGDVGSGKTVVAAFAIFASFVNNLQSILLAPTQVLAEQHYKTLRDILGNYNLRISLVTGSKTEADLGRQDLFVGTHALLHRPKLFENTGVVIIDEQHRFGVNQRALILEHSKTVSHTPHVLSMTATPIPRTVTLTIYGDLDISILNELPSGRKEIKTWVVPENKRKPAYAWIEDQITKVGAQAFVVCPLIEESEAETHKDVKAVTAEYQKLKKVFKTLKVGILHGRLKPKEKTEVLDDFRNKKYDILVTTPVVEVGVDIPNATIMMIEAADRFGLAQIHQLRGRVGRGEKQSYCLLFSSSKSKKALTRLKLVSSTTKGSDLAQIDLETRGPGEIFGLKQHGAPELKVASWTDIELIKKSRQFAEKIVANQNKYKPAVIYYNSKITSKN